MKWLISLSGGIFGRISRQSLIISPYFNHEADERDADHVEEDGPQVLVQHPGPPNLFPAC